MEKLIALVALGIAGVGIQVMTFWYVYGLWPQTWIGYIALGIAAGLISALSQSINVKG